MVKTRIETFPEIEEMVDFFETLPEYDAAMYTHKKMKTNTESSLEVLTELLPILEAQEDYSNDALYQTCLLYTSGFDQFRKDSTAPEAFFQILADNRLTLPRDIGHSYGKIIDILDIVIIKFLHKTPLIYYILF